MQATISPVAVPPPIPMASPVAHPSSADAPESSIAQMLTRGYTLPCSTAAQVFSQMITPSNRFQLALDALLPVLESSQSELSHRILVAYILYSMYAPHPIRLNPFKSALYDAFVKERDIAIAESNGGGPSDREQLVWVLYKILTGDGEDLGASSPNNLAQSALPPKLRASSLVLSEEPPEDDLTPPLPEDEIAGEQEPVSAEVDARTHALSQAMTLLLAARERVLTLSELRLLTPLILDLTSPPVITSFDLPPLVANNPRLAHPLLVAILSRLPNGTDTYLDVVAQLPPTLQTFDVLGHLLRDSTSVRDYHGGNTTIADIVRLEVLGRFVVHSISWLDDAEVQEREGLVSDDRFPQGVRNLCRFYTSLIKLGIVDPSSDTDSAEMITFTLRQARFEEANVLYRTLAAGRY